MTKKTRIDYLKEREKASNPEWDKWFDGVVEDVVEAEREKRKQEVMERIDPDTIIILLFIMFAMMAVCVMGVMAVVL